MTDAAATTSSRPTFFYGTAWKETETKRLTALALACGFRAIDTANQRRHYFEAAVGEAIRAAIDGAIDGLRVSREDLFLQTKFTYEGGQDHRLPYDPRAPVATQVRQSFESSLAHLHTSYLDAYLLHGPASRFSLTADDHAVWRAMEALHDEGQVRALGVSNVSAAQLEELVRSARIPPAFVQNRCFARLGWDAEVREVCRREGLAYEAFSLLTANTDELAHPLVGKIARRLEVTPAEVVFRFARDLEMIPITGTSNLEHMRRDLASAELHLTDEERGALVRIASR